MEFVAIITSVFALGFSLFQHFTVTSQNRKNITIQAYDLLEDKVFIDKKFMCDDDIERITELSKMEFERTIKPAVPYHSDIYDEWLHITNVLSHINHFSIGVNNRLYDIRVVRQLGGKALVSQYHRTKKVIELTRRVYDKNAYEAFEILVKTLEKE